MPGGATQRHHVRLWRSDEFGLGGRPLWIGAATFDRGVGVSHYTGEITHHIAPDIDDERDDLMNNLAGAGQVEREFQVTGVGATLSGRNGGGDRYFTDGELTVGIISADNLERTIAPRKLDNPTAVALKNKAMSNLRPLLR